MRLTETLEMIYFISTKSDLRSRLVYLMRNDIRSYPDLSPIRTWYELLTLPIDEAEEKLQHTIRELKHYLEQRNEVLYEVQDWLKAV